MSSVFWRFWRYLRLVCNGSSLETCAILKKYPLHDQVMTLCMFVQMTKALNYSNTTVINWIISVPLWRLSSWAYLWAYLRIQHHKYIFGRVLEINNIASKIVMYKSHLNTETLFLSEVVFSHSLPPVKYPAIVCRLKFHLFILNTNLFTTKKIRHSFTNEHIQGAAKK